MRLLLIDTCGTVGSVALTEGAVVVAEEKLPGRSASERLVAMVRALMERQGWALRDLAAVAVVHGPGSFTGVRVGLSAAKGLCEAAELPLVAISRLAVLAAMGEGRIWSALDAGRGEFYLGEYTGTECVREMLVTREELKAAVGLAAVVVCEDKAADELRPIVELHLVEEPGAADAAVIAAARVDMDAFDDVATIDANYLRRTDAQLFAWAKP